MDTAFLVKLLLTFVVGSLWITYTTVIAEKLGSKVGGVLGSMPSTIVISLFFIGWTQSTYIASQSASIVPIMMGVGCLLVVIYSFLLKYNFYIAISFSLAFWSTVAFILATNHFDNFLFGLILFIVLLILSFYILENLLKIKSSLKQIYKPSFSNLLFRGLLSGTMVSLSVVFAKFGGPVIGGIFASFPAVFLSSMIITYFAKGNEFSRSVMKVLMLGTTNVVVYASAVKFLYPILGLFIGTLASFLISLLSVGAIFWFVKKIT